MLRRASLFALDKSKAQVLDMEHGLIEQVRDVRVVEGVHDAPPAPLADHQPEVAKHAQLVRHRGALHPHGQGEFVHGAGSLAEPRQNANPARRRKRLHRLRNLPRGRGIDDGGPTVPFDSVTHTATIAERMLRCS
jgi:hypothetical protein